MNYILQSYIIYKYYYAFTCYAFVLISYIYVMHKRMFNRYDALLWSQYSAQ